MRIDVLTLFPEMFAGVLESSILRRAAEPVRAPATGTVREPVVSYHLTDIRRYSTDRHQKVDQPSFGGGPGMVIQCQPVWDAVQAVEAQDARPATRVLMTPQGRPLSQALAEELAASPRLLILAGHYEGLDERVIDHLRQNGGIEEVSIGDYVLSGGELPAMVLIDAVVRLLPGVLGDEQSAHQDSFSPGAERLLDHPHYTRPREWEGMAVPEVLLSGDHAKIEAWRRAEALRRTRERRPDLLGPSSGAAGETSVAIVRSEQRGDEAGIHAVHHAAFGREAEGRLVRRLREDGDLLVSVVATAGDQIIGHAAISPVTLEGQRSLRGLFGLAPVAVAPEWQVRGIGKALVEQALERSRELAAVAVFVLGDPAYYGRFGFTRASDRGFTCEYDALEAFQMLPLRERRLEGLSGQVCYAAAFRESGV